MTITTAQIRGARGILNWSQADLAARTGISATSIGSIENGQSTPRANTMATIQKAFENSGIEFLGLEGVRTKTGNVRTFTGRDGFWDFYQDIYGTLKNETGTHEIVVSNVDERNFEKWLTPERIETHIARIKEIGDVRYKILIREGDTYYLAASEHSEYRWLPRTVFSSVPFYVYGKKLAIVLFDAEPTVIVLEYPVVAEAYRAQFIAMWGGALIPETSTAKSKKA